jgi:hypothetical protein
LLPNGLPFPVQSETLTHAAMTIGTMRKSPRMTITGVRKSHPAAAW